MPLVAIVDGVRMESVFLSDEEWQKIRLLKGMTVMSCGSSGHPRTSNLGLKYFSHNPGSHCDLHPGGESELHLRAKGIVAQVAKELGYTATIEYPAPDRSWIADVLIEKDGVRTAVEVQWSGQSSDDFRHRTERYQAAGINTIWLAGPKSLAFAGGTTHFGIDARGEEIVLTVDEPIRSGGVSLELRAGLRHILTAKISRNVDVVANWLIVDAVMIKCWRPECDKWMSAWFVRVAGFETRCGIKSSISTSYIPHQADRVERLIEDEIRILGARSRLPAFTRFNRRYSKVVEMEYMAQICPHCNTMQGDGPLILERGHAFESWQATGQRRFPIDLSSIDPTHHCVDIGRGHCRPQERSPVALRSSDPFSRFGHTTETERELGRDLHVRRPRG
ncbi:competence protein CoiA [Homoserinimonas sp. A520]